MHSLRCDDGIWLAFKQATKALGSSVCSTAETLFLGVIASYETMKKNNVNIGNTFEINMQVYRQLGRDRRKVNPAMAVDLDTAPLIKLAGPFVEYYLGRPSLNPTDNQLYAVFKADGLDLAWESRKALAMIVLRGIREGRR